MRPAATPSFVGEVFDSDGVHLVASSQPSGSWVTFLQIDRALSHFMPGYSPFGDDGHMLSEEEIRDQDALYEGEFAQARDRVTAAAAMGRSAATRAASWARESGLTPSSVDDIAAVIDGKFTFAEEHFFQFINSLGLREEG